ncbi:hypothetical protein [Methanolapillus ohkumae]|uniref:Serine protease n=1 Tax=Methanolapillus ohkumae TaxID=3028298 RepID=A0AA96ZV42_9EURY|nr:hypothetical protein MsAm2_00740 [Methanosarcinaceae archaeon Am2]
MNKLKMTSFCILAISIIFLGVLSSVLADDGLKENPLTLDEQVKEQIENSKQINSGVLDQLRKEENVLAVYGYIPEINDGGEYYNWWTSIFNTTMSVSKTGALDEYVYENEGYIIGFGPESDGYITILVYNKYGKDINTKDFEIIKSIFDKYGLEENISDVPIVFKSADIPVAYGSSYDSKYRPLYGGITIGTSKNVIINLLSPGSGCIGYTARKNGTTTYGFITAGHIVDFSNNREVYQPVYALLGDHNLIGTSNITHSRIDAVFVKSGNITGTNEARIQYSNSASGSSNFIDVGGYYGTNPTNLTVYKSGSTTYLEVES